MHFKHGRIHFTTLFFATLVFSALISGCNNNSKPGDSKKITLKAEETAVIMIYSFYHQYIILNSVETVNQEQVTLLKKQHCTPDLLNSIEKEQPDYDKFLNAQDCDFEWIKTLKVEVDFTDKNLYNVTYRPLDQPEVKVRIKVNESKDTFRIDSIL